MGVMRITEHQRTISKAWSFTRLLMLWDAHCCCYQPVPTLLLHNTFDLSITNYLNMNTRRICRITALSSSPKCVVLGGNCKGMIFHFFIWSTTVWNQFKWMSSNTLISLSFRSHFSHTPMNIYHRIFPVIWVIVFPVMEMMLPPALISRIFDPSTLGTPFLAAMESWSYIRSLKPVLILLLSSLITSWDILSSYIILLITYF